MKNKQNAQFVENARVILGIDPGSRIMGYGIILAEKNKQQFIHSGYLSVANESMSVRLAKIYQQIDTLIESYAIDEVSIESVFMHVNPNSALKLGQARGAAIAAIGQAILYEYTPRQVKQSVVGYGQADKQQIQHMVRLLLQLKQALQVDEADALAVALCHANQIPHRSSIRAQKQSTE